MTTKQLLFLSLGNFTERMLKRFCTEAINGTEAMTLDLIESKKQADILREQAARLENRAIERLIDEIREEWTDKEIDKALRVSLAKH